MQQANVLSVIVPCYNEGGDGIHTLYRCVKSVIDGLLDAGTIGGYELFFVNDGSGDDTLQAIRSLSRENPNVRYISFTRNFGKEAAMLAGLEHCVGDYVVIMDADLQDPPELLPDMFAEMHAEEGCECVATRRTTRKGEPLLRSLFSRLFYKLINRISEVEIVDGARDFRLMSRRMVNSILDLKEKSRFSKGLFVWSGFPIRYLEYNNVERAVGKTKWSFWKLVKYSMDGITAFSMAPLQAASALGLLCFTGSLLAVLFFVIQKLFFGIAVQGYALMICSIFLLGGLQLLGIGVLGLYLAKVFIESKHRPDYVIQEYKLADEPVPGAAAGENDKA